MATITKARMTMDDLRLTPEFRKLTSAQKMMVETYIASGGDKILAVRSAYATKSHEVARVMSYEAFQSPRVRAAINLLEQKSAFDIFIEKVDSLIDKGTRITDAEVAALALEAKLKGWL